MERKKEAFSTERDDVSVAGGHKRSSSRVYTHRELEEEIIFNTRKTPPIEEK